MRVFNVHASDLSHYIHSAHSDNQCKFNMTMHNNKTWHCSTHTSIYHGHLEYKWSRGGCFYSIFHIILQVSGLYDFYMMTELPQVHGISVSGESELPVCWTPGAGPGDWTWVARVGSEAANHYTDAILTYMSCTTQFSSILVEGTLTYTTGFKCIFRWCVCVSAFLCIYTS